MRFYFRLTPFLPIVYGGREGGRVSEPEHRVTRVARAMWTVTSQIFRCPGLQPVAPDADKLGAHDLACWVIFLFVLAGWFLFVLIPQAERHSMLEERCQVLTTHLKAEKSELARLRRSIDELRRGDPRAWERAARGQLGWVEPGEVTDLSHGLPVLPPASSTDASKKKEAAAKPPARPAAPPPPAQPLPAPPGAPPAAPRAPEFANGSDGGAELFGPLGGSPPQPPPPSVRSPQKPPQPPQPAPAARNVRNHASE